MKHIKRKIWIIVDTHFTHRQMIDDLGRPEDYERQIWKSLKKIDSKDLLIHLGDVCHGNDEEVHKKLRKFKFKKVLVRGNHDHKSNNWYMNRGWDFVCRGFSDKYFGKKIAFSHKPIVWDGKYELNLHGHFHNISEKYHEEELVEIKNDKQKLIALEYLGYGPILLENLLNKIENKEI